MYISQSDAKAIAETVLGKPMKTKVIRGRCCLFVKGETFTEFYGLTWAAAVATFCTVAE